MATLEPVQRFFQGRIGGRLSHARGLLIRVIKEIRLAALLGGRGCGFGSFLRAFCRIRFIYLLIIVLSNFSTILSDVEDSALIASPAKVVEKLACNEGLASSW